MQCRKSRSVKVVFANVVFLVVWVTSCDGNLAHDSIGRDTSINNKGNGRDVVTSTPVFSAIAPSVKTNAWNDRLIRAGDGTTFVRLGMTRDELITVLGKPLLENSHNGWCEFAQLQWLPPANPDGTLDGDGIFAFLKNEKVFEIRFGESYYTADGIHVDSTLKDLEEKVSAPLYRLIPSANTATNDEDLFFMVAKDKGIAYEIAAGYKTKERGVSAIYVFQPNSDFLPWGCVSENQSFVEIPYPP